MRGRGVIDEAMRPGWHDEVAAAMDAVRALEPGGRAVQGDAVPLPFDDDAFDRVFTGSFYGHLFEHEREPFLAEARRVAPELVVLDAALRDGGVPEEWQERKLDDGSRHRVYKRFFTADGLLEELGGGRVLHAGRWFVMVAAP